jgi:hypothetical protein
MPQRKKCDPERMKVAIEAVRNKEMGRYKASRVFNVAQTTLERYVKDQQKPCEAEDDIAEHCLLMEKKLFGMTMADAMHLAYQLAVRNGIDNQFCKRN